MRILCTGDLHLGRQASKVPQAAQGGGGPFSTRAMWHDLVDYAVDEQVDCVALSGDVVDQDNRWFEAVGPLADGLLKLGEAGIDTFAVAGNHDVEVLPKLADSLVSERFHLLGRGGTWEQLEVARDGHRVLRVQGWSFPERYYDKNPLDDYPFTQDADIPTLALLHTDLDAARSRYAPVRREELERQPVALWLLGHIHVPNWREGSPARPGVLMPGSALAMDPGETGPHGPWLVEIDAAHRATARHVELSRVRYETLDVELDAVDEPGQLESHVTRMVREAVQHWIDEATRLEYVSLRLRLTGRTPFVGDVARNVVPHVNDLELSIGGVRVVVERASDETAPAVDLIELSRAKDPPGELAKLLLELETHTTTAGERSAECESLVGSALAAMENVFDHRVYADVACPNLRGNDERPTECDAHDELVRQGRRLLHTMLSQKERA